MQVRGEVGPELWRGRVEKGSPSKATLWVVFPIFVRESAHEWPESAIRDRIWVRIVGACTAAAAAGA